MQLSQACFPPLLLAHAEPTPATKGPLSVRCQGRCPVGWTWHDQGEPLPPKVESEEQSSQRAIYRLVEKRLSRGVTQSGYGKSAQNGSVPDLVLWAPTFYSLVKQRREVCGKYVVRKSPRFALFCDTAEYCAAMCHQSS